MGTVASQIASLTIVNSTVYSGVDQRKHQRSASLAFVRGIYRWPVNSPHKWPVTRKMFPFDDVIVRCQVDCPGRHRDVLTLVLIDHQGVMLTTFTFQCPTCTYVYWNGNIVMLRLSSGSTGSRQNIDFRRSEWRTFQWWRHFRFSVWYHQWYWYDYAYWIFICVRHKVTIWTSGDQ